MHSIIESIESHKLAGRSPTLCVTKVYLDEDPAKDEHIFCPCCKARNRTCRVRYVYINLYEAIFKCEGHDCMYPFRGFKFKNDRDNTVYYYRQKVTPMVEALQTPHVFHHLPQDDPLPNNVLGIGKDTNLPIVDCPLDRYLPTANSSPNLTEVDGTCVRSLTDFNTDFIDDMLQDLSTSSSPSGTPNVVSSYHGEPNVRPAAKETEPNRKLQRCLKLFQQAENSKPFRVPVKRTKRNATVVGGHVVEALSPTKVKIKRLPGVSTGAMLRHTQEVSLQVSMAQKEPATVKGRGDLPSNSELANRQRRDSNEKVKVMLSFIERSLKQKGAIDMFPPLPAEASTAYVPQQVEQQNTRSHPETVMQDTTHVMYNQQPAMHNESSSSSAEVLKSDCVSPPVADLDAKVQLCDMGIFSKLLE